MNKGNTGWKINRKRMAAALTMKELQKKLQQLVDGSPPPPVPASDDEDPDVQDVTSHVSGAGAGELRTPDNKGINKQKFGSGMSTISHGTSRTSLGDSGDGDSQCGDLGDMSAWEHKIMKYDIVAILSGQKMGKERRRLKDWIDANSSDTTLKNELNACNQHYAMGKLAEEISQPKDH
eukprot:9486513-Pyramimonas_sp.AAC.1